MREVHLHDVKKNEELLNNKINKEDYFILREKMKSFRPSLPPSCLSLKRSNKLKIHYMHASRGEEEEDEEEEDKKRTRARKVPVRRMKVTKIKREASGKKKSTRERLENTKINQGNIDKARGEKCERKNVFTTPSSPPPPPGPPYYLSALPLFTVSPFFPYLFY